MTRTFIDAPQGERCTATITLADKSTAQCGRRGSPNCWQHSFRVRVNLNDDGFLIGAWAQPTGGFKALLGYAKFALRFSSNDEAVAAVARCVNIDAATIEPIGGTR